MYMLSPLIHHVGFHQRFIFYSYLRSSSLNRHEISLQAENHVVAQVNENIQKTDAVEHQLKMFRSKKSVLEKPKLAVKNIIDYEAKRTRRNVPTTKDKSTQTDAVIIEGTEVKVLTSRSALSFSAEHSATTSTRKEKLIKENKAKKLAVEKTEASAKSSSKKQVVSVKSESVEKRIGKEIAAVSTTEPASSPKIKETVVKKDPARPSPEIKSKTLPSDSVEAKIENKISAVSTAESISSAKIDDTVVKKDSTKAPLEIKLKPVHSDGVETRTVKEIAAAPATKPSSSSGKVQTIETDVKKDAARSSPEIKSKTLPSVNVEAKIEKQITAVSTAKPTSDPKTEDTAVEKHSARASPDTKSKSVPADSVEAKIEKQIATASATKSSSYSKKAKNNGKEIKKDSARVSPERKPKPVPSELPQEATTSSSSEKSATVQTAANGRTAANGATMAMLAMEATAANGKAAANGRTAAPKPNESHPNGANSTKLNPVNPTKSTDVSKEPPVRRNTPVVSSKLSMAAKALVPKISIPDENVEPSGEPQAPTVTSPTPPGTPTSSKRLSHLNVEHTIPATPPPQTSAPATITAKAPATKKSSKNRSMN